MSFLSRVLTPRGRLLLAPFLLVVPLASAPGAAQSFAVGGGGSIISDQGTLVDVNSFDHWGGNVFGELSLGNYSAQHAVVLQLRGTFFSLPGGAPDSPDLRGVSGLSLVFYRFREAWWEAGLFGGVGLYHFSPKTPGPGQVVADPTETVVGFAGGLQTLFRVSRSFDFRLELSGEVPRTQADHKMIFLTAAVGYRF
jgi:hypothetical protein